MAVATYPGTVSPLRGLDPFGEGERDVLFGRDRAREDVVKLVSGDNFRTGLIYGESGVGKTSLLRAGILPHLRDHGVVILNCEDASRPATAFATALSQLGVMPQAGEQPTAFLARAVSATVQGQQFVFVLDDLDAICQDDRAVAELAEVFSRVVGRSGGRARCLFTCAADRVHLLALVEKRTGSLFPPQSRYELGRMPPAEASSVLDRVLALSGVAADPRLAEAVVQGLGRGAPVLPADLQIAALAMRELRIDSQHALQKAGGGRELCRAWLHAACRSTGDERAALRLVAEIADGASTADEASRELGFDPNAAYRTLGALEQAGVLTRLPDDAWGLRHDVLASRIREITAPARDAARRAHDVLGSKTAPNARLSFKELLALRRDAIAPVTPEERAIFERSRRFWKLIAGVVAAIPIAILILLWFANRGKMYFDLEARPGGARVVAVAGRAGLSAFHWLPASPGYGDVVADTGLSRAMVAPEAWKKIADQDLGGDLDGWDGDYRKIMAPQLAGLIDYATGDEKALERLTKAAQKDDAAFTELLTVLRSIARGAAAEVALVEAALETPSPVVQRAAVAVAGAAAQRKPGVYKDTLVKALIAADPELRRIAVAAVRAVGGDSARTLYSAALAKGPDASAKREILIEMSAASTDEAPSPGSAASVLADPDAPPALKDRAKSRLARALSDDPKATAKALLPLVAEERVPGEARIHAINLLRQLDPMPEGIGDVGQAAHDAFNSPSESVRAAALPLYAKVDATRAATDLATLLPDKKQSKAMREATALGWGELARTGDAAAGEALAQLIKDGDADVRAAAATAYGNIGRPAQEELTKMVKNEGLKVAVGAAEGLAITAELGASPGTAVGGIAQLWKQKGKAKREAARIYARLARKKPASVMAYLVSAANDGDDPGLHPIGVEGLCNAATVGSADARRNLIKVTANPSVDVRRRLIRCVADGPDPEKNGVAVAAKLVRDEDGTIRAEAARILAMSAGQGKVSGGVSDALLPLLEDRDREVRLIAYRAVGSLAGDAPKAADAALARMFEKADEAEKRAILKAGKAIDAKDLVSMAAADASPLVRVDAIDAALATGGSAASALNAALTDVDPQVRRAALEKLATSSQAMDPAALEKALALAVRDADPGLSQLALTTLAQVSPKESVSSRLGRALTARAERERAQAAAATIGLVDRDAVLASDLLTPLLDDPSHDVRVALVPSLAAAWARTNSPEKLAGLLRGSEGNAMRRLVAVAAFITLAKTDTGKAAATATLTKIAQNGGVMAKAHARLALGLIDSDADGLAFLQELVP
jgi:HEAT repeat protein